jgi:hypothetical protein
LWTMRQAKKLAIVDAGQTGVGSDHVVCLPKSRVQGFIGSTTAIWICCRHGTEFSQQRISSARRLYTNQQSFQPATRNETSESSAFFVSRVN